jgi:hypothetical protein
VLVAGAALRETVESIEERIIPCVTAVCPECDRVSIISDGSTESILCSIFMWQRLREWIDVEHSTLAAAAAVPGVVSGASDDVKEGVDLLMMVKAEDLADHHHYHKGANEGGGGGGDDALLLKLAVAGSAAAPSAFLPVPPRRSQQA